MHVNSILIVMLFMISIIATCVKAENQVDNYPEKNISKKITKRESSVLIDNYPLDTINNKKEQVFIKKISKPRGRTSDSRYYRPLKRPTNRKLSKPKKKKLSRIPTGGAWSPYKSNKRPHYSYKHGSGRRPVKTDYYESRPQSQLKLKGKRKKVNKTRQHIYNSPRPVGFGEPPLDFLSHHEPPEADPMDLYDEAQAALASRKPYPLDTAALALNDDMPPLHHDSSFAFSNTHPKVIVPDVNAFDSPVQMDFNENSIGGLYPNIYQREKNNKMFQLGRRRPTAHIADDFLKFHIKDDRHRERRYENEQEIVGGQYAEPPARFVSRTPENEQFDDDDEDDEFSPNIYVNTKFDTKYATSANISPYVNYKNGNIAFSPQNLNDAFSIVDK